MLDALDLNGNDYEIPFSSDYQTIGSGHYAEIDDVVGSSDKQTYAGRLDSHPVTWDEKQYAVTSSLNTDGSGYLVPRNNSTAAYATINDISHESTTKGQKSGTGEYMSPTSPLINPSFDVGNRYAKVEEIIRASKDKSDTDDGYAVPDEFGFEEEVKIRHDTVRLSDYVDVEATRLNIQQDDLDDEVA